MSYWLIFFEDAEKHPEVFTDERAAQTRFVDVSENWNCHLFCESAQLADRDARILQLEKALRFVAHADLNDKVSASNTKYIARVTLAKPSVTDAPTKPTPEATAKRADNA